MRDNPKSFHQETGQDAQFVQDNRSRSGKGARRSLRYQIRQAPCKLVRVARCSMWWWTSAKARPLSRNGWGWNSRKTIPASDCADHVHFTILCRADRQTARSLFSEGEFVENFGDAPLEIAEAHDP